MRTPIAKGETYQNGGLESFKLKLTQIFLSHFRFILDLKDFITNTVYGIGKCANERIKSESSRYRRYSLDRIVEWDKDLVLEMALIKIFSEYERFLTVFFYEIRKLDEKYNEWYPRGTKNIRKISNYLKKIFRIDMALELDCWSDLVESYYRRNVFVHNKGKIEAKYIKNIDNCSPKEKNKYLKISLSYMGKCINSILSLYEFIYLKIINFFQLDNMDKILSIVNKMRSYGIDQSFFIKFRLKAW